MDQITALVRQDLTMFDRHVFKALKSTSERVIVVLEGATLTGRVANIKDDTVVLVDEKERIARIRRTAIVAVYDAEFGQ